MTTDSIADTLTRIRNAQRARHRTTRVAVSKATKSILDVILREGFIQSYELESGTDGKFDSYKIYLKFYDSGKPAITVLHRVSKPGKRVYSKCTDLPVVFSGLGVSIISTSQGVISDREARKRQLGGEVLALVG